MNSPPRLLLIDDDRAFRVGTGALLADEGYEVEPVGSGEAGLRALSGARFDLVLLDVKMEGKDGLSVLREIRGKGGDLPIIMLTGFGTVESAVDALKAGATDYITKPCDNELLRSKIRATLARRRPVLGQGAVRLTAESQRMKEVLRAVARVAPSESNVLLRGATGTGKELVARTIHEESPRRNGPFIPVNCSALAEGLLESELFGHARGSFTGAVADRKGLFEEAGGGTLFLDEVGDVSPAMQAKLLRVLQEREVVRVGTARSIPVDVRVIAATHQDLERLVEEKRFRADLYFRLKVFQIPLPELRDRPEDIAPLLNEAIARWNRGTVPARRVTEWSEETLSALEAYDWPGNVRELMTAVEHACIVAEGGRLLPCHLPEEILEPKGREANGDAKGGEPRRYQAPAAGSERRAIVEALQRADGNRTRAAAYLGMGRTTLWQKIKAYGLEQM